MPELRPVTKDNWLELSRLNEAEGQDGFVAPNVFSIAERSLAQWMKSAAGICIRWGYMRKAGPLALFCMA